MKEKIILKKKNNKNITQLFIVTMLVGLGYILLFSQPEISESQKNALDKVLFDLNKAPDFTLQSIDDSIYTLSKLNGKVVLINFWATWCGPCRMEIPEFNELEKKYKTAGFEILGISVSDNKKQLQNFVKSVSVEYKLLFGSSKEMNKIMKDYGGVYAVPSSFLVNKKGEIVWSYPGAVLKDYDPKTFETLVYEIEKSLAQATLNE
jgi:peroxiredoxin